MTALASTAERWPVKQVLGVPLAAVTLREALDLVERSIESRRPLHIGVVNAAKMVNMTRDPRLGASVLASDVIFADGMAVVWASRVLGQRLPERVPGIDLMAGMLERGSRRGYRVFFLGATDAVLREVLARTAADYPGVRIAGSRNGYFTPDEEAAVAAEIAASHADILFVAMTSPKKENFMDQWAATLNVPICHGVGGSFDVMAGIVRRAPALWQKLGLEWLYRVAQEPRRLWKRYLVTNTLFVMMVLRHLVGRDDAAAAAHGTTMAQPAAGRRR